MQTHELSVLGLYITDGALRLRLLCGFAWIYPYSLSFTERTTAEDKARLSMLTDKLAKQFLG